MISRIYVMLKKGTRANSYLVDSNLSKKELGKLAGALTNPILEKYSIHKFPEDGLREKFSHANAGQAYVIEIGFKPGVTDNVGSTVKEIATDLFRLKNNSDFYVYTSKIFFTSGSLKNTEEFALTLYNPLIERAFIASIKNGKINLPMKVPKVVLKKRKPVLNVSLDVRDEELMKIGKEGIKDEDETRRGPLALDLSSMKAIKAYFSKFKRDPTDIELESLAQTWSEHCKHTIFANPIDDIKDGLYK